MAEVADFCLHFLPEVDIIISPKMTWFTVCALRGVVADLL